MTATGCDVDRVREIDDCHWPAPPFVRAISELAAAIVPETGDSIVRHQFTGVIAPYGEVDAAVLSLIVGSDSWLTEEPSTLFTPTYDITGSSDRAGPLRAGSDQRCIGQAVHQDWTILIPVSIIIVPELAAVVRTPAVDGATGSSAGMIGPNGDLVDAADVDNGRRNMAVRVVTDSELAFVVAPPATDRTSSRQNASVLPIGVDKRGIRETTHSNW